MRNPFRISKKKQSTTKEDQNLSTMALVTTGSKPKQAEDLSIKNMYQWLSYTLQNGGNSDYVLLALLKQYFNDQNNNKYPKYKIITPVFIVKVKKFIDEYFKLKDVPILSNPSVVTKVIQNLDLVEQQQQEGENDYDETTLQYKKIIVDSIERWQKYEEDVMNQFEKILNSYKTFTDEERAEYKKSALNVVDATGKFSSLVVKHIDRMLFEQSGK